MKHKLRQFFLCNFCLYYSRPETQLKEPKPGKNGAENMKHAERESIEKATLDKSQPGRERDQNIASDEAVAGCPASCSLFVAQASVRQWEGTGVRAMKA